MKKITDSLVNDVVRIEGIGNMVVTPDLIPKIISGAARLGAWDPFEVVCWPIADGDQDVFLITFDLPNGSRIATTSFDLKDADAIGYSTSNPVHGIDGIRTLLEFADMLIRNAYDNLRDIATAL